MTLRVLVAQDAPQPRTRRGRESRQRLFNAARHVFEEKGFLDARTQDISTAAGMGQGSFYDYFTSKEDVFRQIALDLAAELLKATEFDLTDSDPYEQIREATRNYMIAFKAHAKMFTILEQVATFNEEFRELRLHIRASGVERTEAAIRHWQELGICDSTIDPHCAACALSSMVGNFTYVWLGLGEEHDFETVLETLSRIRAHGIGLRGSLEHERQPGRSH